jgi:hypothetical protein
MDSNSVAQIWILAVVIWTLLFGFIGAAIGTGKGRYGQGFALGFFLGFIGVIIIAVMEPTEAKRLERDNAKMAMLRSAMASTAPASGGHMSSSDVHVTPEIRAQLMATAIERDPTLADSTSSESLQRLDTAMAVLEREYLLKTELETLQQAQQEERERLAAEAAAATQARVEQKLRDAADAQEKARLAAMSPLRRWIAHLYCFFTQNPLVTALAVVVAVIIGVVAIAGLSRIPGWEGLQ